MIATFRSDASGEAFAMFDFAPVGVGVALTGLAFIALVGWRLIPQHEVAASGDLFEISDYLFEVRVPEGSRTHGQSIADLGAASGAEFVVAAIARGDRRIALPSSFEVLRAGDVLVVEASGDALEALVADAGLEAVGSREHALRELGAGDVVVAEAVVMPDSPLRARTVIGANLRRRFQINLLAISRRGRQYRTPSAIRCSRPVMCCCSRRTDASCRPRSRRWGACRSRSAGCA